MDRALLLLFTLLASLSCSQKDAAVVVEEVAEEVESAEEVSLAERASSLDRVAVAGIQIRQFHYAMDQYRLSNYKYPESLTSFTENDGMTGEPILKAIPMDPWGNSYQMEFDSEGKSYIICFGADGVEGGDGFNQDISSQTLGL